MKKVIFYLIGFFALFTSCTESELPTYSGAQAIQFAGPSDSTLSYMFYYDEPSVESATVNFKVQTTGYLSDVDRTYKVEQIFPDGVNTAEAGVHFEALSDDQFVVKAGAVTGQAPITILRSNLESKKIYQLTIQIIDNENFEKGDSTLLVRKLIFSRDLLRPNGWTDYYSKYYFGSYSVNKHAWMIENTGQKWDDEFFQRSIVAESLAVYWRDVLNLALLDYNKNVGPLYDDDGVEITQFP